MIELTALHKSYGSRAVLKGVHATFLPGIVYGIIGANGAGKTTLFSCMAGLTSYEGSVTSSFDDLKNSIGYLPTQPDFMSLITGWEYLRLVCVARGIETSDFEAANIFDLPLHQYAENYSTGMKKKLALTGELLRKNETFILDEPFNGVDLNSNILMKEIILRLKAANKTVLISSHILATIKELCDEVHLLKDGILHRRLPDQYQALESELQQDDVMDRLDRLIL